MQSTRLLVLGAVRILQPVHGYDVRRELTSWHLNDWTNIQTGSVYSALKTLEKDGLISVTSTSSQPGRPARTEYELTADGEKEFQTLLRLSWWRVEPRAEPLVPALCLFPLLERAELAAALKSRVSQLEAQLAEYRFLRASIRDGASGANGEVPEHVREFFDFATSRVQSEIEWARAFERKLRAGEYELVGDERHAESG